jgi:hypothetical protein
VAAGFFECGTSFPLWGKFPHCDGRNTYCGSRSIRPLRLPIMGVEFYTFWVLHTTFWAYLLGPRRVLICCTNLSLCRSLYYEKGLLGLLEAAWNLCLAIYIARRSNPSTNYEIYLLLTEISVWRVIYYQDQELGGRYIFSGQRIACWRSFICWEWSTVILGEFVYQKCCLSIFHWTSIQHKSAAKACRSKKAHFPIIVITTCQRIHTYCC